MAGALAKLALVFWLYALNTVSVGGNLLLQWRLGRPPAAPIGLTTAG